MGASSRPPLVRSPATRGCWLTQDLLKAGGWGYLTLWVLALGLSVWLPKGWLVKTIMVVDVLGFGGILPLGIAQHVALRVRERLRRCSCGIAQRRR